MSFRQYLTVLARSLRRRLRPASRLQRLRSQALVIFPFMSGSAIQYKRRLEASEVSAVNLQQPRIRATFAGAGNLSVYARQRHVIRATFAGVGSLSADTVQAGQQAANATFAGAGSLQVLDHIAWGDPGEVQRRWILICAGADG